MKKIENISICASAGTGKTYNLVKRYISLLAAGVNPSTIIALTFTRNAAGEIFSRIILRLLELIKNPDSADKEFKGVSAGKFSEILKNLLLSLNKLQIGTLDSFFVKIITTFAFEFGLPADIKVVDEQMQSFLMSKALKRTLESTVNEDDLKTFAEEFKKATFGHEEKNIFSSLEKFVSNFHQLYILVPDEDKWGKKEKIFKDKNSIIFQDFDLNSLKNEVSILFSNSLNEKQKEKIKNLIQIALEIIDENPNVKLSQIANFFAAYEDIKGENAVITVERKKVNFNQQQCKILQKLIEYIAKRKIEKKLEETQGVYRIIRRYDEIYNNQIRANGLIAFSDLPFILSPNKDLGVNHYTLSSATGKNPDDRLYVDYRLDSKFEHWLIDEFQDTSLPQWQIIENLIDEVVMDTSGRRSFFYVGDPKQAIYGWRGGLVELFNAVKQKYIGNISEGDELIQSRRSAKNIIDTVNKVFLNLNKLLPPEFKDIFPFSEHKQRPEKCDDKSKDGYCSLVQIIENEDSDDEKAKIIASQIKIIEPFKRKLSVAILCRTNDTAAKISRLLHHEGINTIIGGQVGICADNPIVPAFLSLFTFAYHPGDDFSWQHLLMTPFALLLNGTKELEELKILDMVQSSGFAKTIEYYKERLEDEANIKFDPFSLMRLEQLIEAAWTFDSSGTTNCDDFVDFIKEYKLSNTSSVNAVQVMTIHKAKGLEFDIVFLPELKAKDSILKNKFHEGIKTRKGNDFLPEVLSFFPEGLVLDVDSDIRKWKTELNLSTVYENLCILYVAMTRAKEALYLIADKSNKSGDSFYFQDLLIKSLSLEEKESQLENAKLLYNCGNENWFESFDLYDEKIDSEDVEKKDLVVLPNLPQIVKPSFAKETKISLSLLLSDEAENARQIGTCIHRLFEEIEWLETSNINEIIDKAKNKLANEFKEEILQSALTEFQNAVSSCEFRNELVKPQSECELWREKSFTIIINGKLVNGQFDRVTIFKDKTGKPISAVILDFKSDALEADSNPDQHAEKHRNQLEIYRKALSKLLSLDEKNISAKIAFTSIGKIIKLF